MGLLIHLVMLYVITQKKFLRWPDGIIIAALISFTIFSANLLYWIILFSFFIPSSILTKSNLERKKNYIISEKTGYRNGLQVLSNSFGLFFFALAQLAYAGIAAKIIFSFLFSGTIFIASASADTWSTEIGTLNKSEPRYILDFRKKVPKGTSGGVSLIGSTGGLLGAILIAIILIIGLALTNTLKNVPDLVIIFILVIIFGFIGQVIDSLLGALLQKKYYCPNCDLMVEESTHQICGSKNLKKEKKYTFLDNNMVNLFSNLFMTGVGFLLINIIHFNPM